MYPVIVCIALDCNVEKQLNLIISQNKRRFIVICRFSSWHFAKLSSYSNAISFLGIALADSIMSSCVELAGTPSFIFDERNMSRFSVKYLVIFCLTWSVETDVKPGSHIAVTCRRLPPALLLRYAAGSLFLM